jgi:hypothetical protein
MYYLNFEMNKNNFFTCCVRFNNPLGKLSLYQPNGTEIMQFNYGRPYKFSPEGNDIVITEQNNIIHYELLSKKTNNMLNELSKTFTTKQALLITSLTSALQKGDNYILRPHSLERKTFESLSNRNQKTLMKLPITLEK